MAEEPLQVIEGAAEPDAAIEAKPPPEEAKPERHDEREMRKMPEREKARREPVAQQTAGGTTSRAQAAGAKSSGRVSASRGSVISYAAQVRAKVARNKPPGNGHRGVAQVSFGVSPSGGLSFARLARSSGSPALDRAALGAVHRAAPFGAPPAGASAAQLRFSIPFYFR
jgi:protein TonB